MKQMTPEEMHEYLETPNGREHMEALMMIGQWCAANALCEELVSGEVELPAAVYNARTAALHAAQDALIEFWTRERGGAA